MGACLCTGCKSLPEIWGTFMQGVQKPASNLGHIYAWGAESSPNSGAYFSDFGMASPSFEAVLHDFGMEKTEK